MTPIKVHLSYSSLTKPVKSEQAQDKNQKKFMLCANTTFSRFFWMEREMAYKTEASPSIFSSNWFLPFLCTLSEKLKACFIYGLHDGAPQDGWLHKGKLYKS